MKEKREIKFKTIITIAIVLSIVLAIILTPLKDRLSIISLKGYIDDARESAWAPLIYIFIYVVSVIFAIPGAALTIIAGPFFGLLEGTLLVIIASNIGTQLTFFISRLAGRDLIVKLIKNESFLDKVSKKIEKNDFLVMLYIRLLPVFPFNVVNYLSGLTPIRYKSYTLATFLGMIPGTFIYVYLSTTASNIKNNPLGIIVPIILLVLLTFGTLALKKKKSIF